MSMQFRFPYVGRHSATANLFFTELHRSVDGLRPTPFTEYSMKWFKHMSGANRDERLAAIRDYGGFELYGFYWFVLETIAEQMDETDKTYVELPIKHWQRITGFYPKKLQRLLKDLQMFGVCSANVQGNIIKVDVPNLLKIRDNYSKNLQATDKQEVEVEVEVDKPPISPLRNVPYDDYFLTWQEVAEMSDLSGINQPSKWSDGRKAAVRKIHNGICGGDIKTFRMALAALQGSSHHIGKNDRGWKMTFDWAVKEANVQKWSEAYDENA